MLMAKNRTNGNGRAKDSDESIRRELEKRGLIELARYKVPESLMIKAYRESGPPSEYIDSPASMSTIPRFGDDQESRRIEEALEAQVRGEGIFGSSERGH